MSSSLDVLILSSGVVESLPLCYQELARDLADIGRVKIEGPSGQPETEKP